MIPNDFDEAVKYIKEYSFNGLSIPEHMAEGLAMYLLNGVPAGGFLTAVLENDLIGAVVRADYENIKRLDVYAAFLYSEASINSYGSPKIVEVWIAKNRAGEVA